MAQKTVRIIQADLSKLPQALDFIVASIQGSLKVRLIAEEALTNIIRHGYKESPGPIEIHCNGSSLQLIDYAVAFNQAAKPVTLDPEHNGLQLIHGLADHITYQRHHDKNILTITSSCN